MKKIVAMASDHAGFEMKEKLKGYLISEGYEVKDFGTNDANSVDYPDYGHVLAESVESGKFEKGIALCGSGNGINMTVNKHQGIRSALCWSPEIAKMARLHNNANICALPARYISFEVVKQIIDIFLNTEFEAGRHLTRINKIPLK